MSWVARRLAALLGPSFVETVMAARQTGAVPHIAAAYEVQARLGLVGNLAQHVLADETHRVEIPYDLPYVKERFCFQRMRMVSVMKLCSDTNTLIPKTWVKPVTLITEDRGGRLTLAVEFGTQRHMMREVAAP